MRTLLTLALSACSPALITSYAGLRTEGLPMSAGDEVEGSLTLAGDFRQGVLAYEADGWASGQVRLRLAGVTSLAISFGGGFPELAHARATVIGTWPRRQSAAVHGGVHGGVGGSLVGQPTGTYELFAVAVLHGGGHLQVRASEAFRWTFGADLAGVPPWYLSASASTGPFFRFPAGGALQPYLAVEGTVTACLTGTCAGFAPGVRLTLGWANQRARASGEGALPGGD